MKKILCLMLCFCMLFAFAACGGGGGEGTDSTASGAVAPTSLKFDAESYTVKVGGYSMVSDHLTVEPQGAKVVYSVSDTSIATITKKGEVEGLKGGEITVTAASEDGKVTATCKVSVVGLGTVVAYDEETNEGGITHKRIGAPETPGDSDAVIIIIPKNLAAGTDMKGAVEFNYGERNDDGFISAKYDGYYVAKTNDKCNFKIEEMLEGDYVALIACSKDYTSKKDYAGVDVASDLKDSAIGKYFTDDELATMAASKILDKREYVVKEFSIKANETTILEHGFAVD